MQVTYQQTLDDWIAAQIFGVEQLAALEKHDKKAVRNLLIYFIVLGAFLFFTGGANAFFWFFVAFVLIWTVYLFLRQASTKRRMIYRRLLIAYGPAFEKEEHKTVSWDVNPEAIIANDDKKEIRFRWDAIQRIVVCPDYLFIDFGGITSWLAFPGGAVPETVYQALCEEVIRTYREQAARAGKLADVIHSEWTIDLGKLKKRRIWGW